MQEKLIALENEAKAVIACASTVKDLEDIKIKYLGRKGQIQDVMKLLPSLDGSVRKEVGKLANDIKNVLTGILDEKIVILSLRDRNLKLKHEAVDITLPGTGIVRAKSHPIMRTFEEMKDVFLKMGYSIAEGPDIESNWYNFEALNFPPEHPAMDMQATFFVDGGDLLRTHTSGVQIRLMEKKKPPIRSIMPGRVYRCDSDVTHSPVFHQLEGLVVDKGITFADLKGTLTHFLHEMFGLDRKVRFRPSFFPFTEPSAEIDVECIICNGAGCRVCKNTGWLEILGAGMVDPNVLKNVKYDPEEYSGFAFGMGIERIAMLKYGISDIRLLYENDIRFLKQF
jgi:phenylalanyl-tRNA synthetase alpha chain